jgi:hypothetical protein
MTLIATRAMQHQSFREVTSADRAPLRLMSVAIAAVLLIVAIVLVLVARTQSRS